MSLEGVRPPAFEGRIRNVRRIGTLHFVFVLPMLLLATMCLGQAIWAWGVYRRNLAGAPYDQKFAPQFFNEAMITSALAAVLWSLIPLNVALGIALRRRRPWARWVAGLQAAFFALLSLAGPLIGMIAFRYHNLSDTALSAVPALVFGPVALYLFSRRTREALSRTV
jgi:hypothetical protein